MNRRASAAQRVLGSLLTIAVVGTLVTACVPEPDATRGVDVETAFRDHGIAVI